MVPLANGAARNMYVSAYSTINSANGLTGPCPLQCDIRQQHGALNTCRLQYLWALNVVQFDRAFIQNNEKLVVFSKTVSRCRSRCFMCLAIQTGPFRTHTPGPDRPVGSCTHYQRWS